MSTQNSTKDAMSVKQLSNKSVYPEIAWMSSSWRREIRYVSARLRGGSGRVGIGPGQDRVMMLALASDNFTSVFRVKIIHIYQIVLAQPKGGHGNTHLATSTRRYGCDDRKIRKNNICGRSRILFFIRLRRAEKSDFSELATKVSTPSILRY